MFLNIGYLFEILYNFIFVIESNIIPNGRNISSKVSNIWLDWTISCYPNLLVLLAELVNEILTSKFLLLIKLGRFHPIFLFIGNWISILISHCTPVVVFCPILARGRAFILIGLEFKMYVEGGKYLPLRCCLSTEIDSNSDFSHLLIISKIIRKKTPSKLRQWKPQTSIKSAFWVQHDFMSKIV